jgi:uncharacterized protein YabE (DUF348 family)
LREQLTALLSSIAHIPARLRLITAGFTIAIITIYAVSSGLLSGHSQALADATRVVSIYVDGQKRVISTDAPTVGELLHRLNIPVAVDDLVEPPMDTPIPQGFFNINIYRARPVTVVDGQRSYNIRTAYQSPRLIAEAAGLKVYPEDTYSTDIITNFVGDGAVGEKLTIDRAMPAIIVADGHKLSIRTQATTVGELIKEKGFSMGPQDTSSVPLASPVTPEVTVAITRVSDVVTTTDETLPHGTTTTYDANAPKGTSAITNPGSDGHRKVTYRIHYRDGAETSRETLKIEGEVKPVSQVISVGTKIQFSGSVEYWRPFVLEAAAASNVDPNLMLAIMRCESNGNANASNGSHFGLYQYSAATWTSYGNSMSTIFDGPSQIRVTAGRLTQKNATSPWLASKFCWSALYPGN